MSQHKPSVDPPLLVTGASGFVGRAVVRMALARGWLVSAAVRGGRAAFDPAVTTFEVGDIADGSTHWAPALDGVGVVIHLAGSAGIVRPGSVSAEVAMRRIHVDASLRLAHAARGAGVRRLVYVSSAKVLGESSRPGQPLRDHSPPDPQDAYSHAKREAEVQLQALHEEGRFEVVVVRPPLVYGPAAAGNLLRLARWIQSGRPLPFASVRNRRSVISLDNLTDALLLSALHPRAPGQTLLVADDRDLSTPELCELIGRMVGRSPRLLPVPAACLSWLADLDRSGALARLTGWLQFEAVTIREQLGWRPGPPCDNS